MKTNFKGEEMKHDRQIIWLAISAVALLGMATWSPANETPEPVETVVTEQVEVDKGAETIILKTKRAKKPASFPHWQHQDSIDCAVCHENELFPTEWNKKTGHETCKDCHKEFKAPTKCKTCHPKSIQPKKKAYEGC